MKRQKPVNTLCTTALLCALSQPIAYSRDVPGMLAEKGIDSVTFNTLVGKGLISSTILNGDKPCELADQYSISDKLLLSDLVVIGRISKVEYLYKQGGPFRTLYTISVSDTWKGGPASDVQVLTTFGPNRRDHRRWKRDPMGVELDSGDEGLFMISTSIFRSGSERVPAEAQEFLRGKGIFVDGLKGVFLIKDGEFDREFLKATGKNETLGLAEAQSTMHSISQILKGK